MVCLLAFFRKLFLQLVQIIGWKIHVSKSALRVGHMCICFPPTTSFVYDYKCIFVDKRRYRESYIYSDPRDLVVNGAYHSNISPRSKTAMGNRYSVVSDASSNTTSGIASDKMTVSFEDSDGKPLGHLFAGWVIFQAFFLIEKRVSNNLDPDQAFGSKLLDDPQIVILKTFNFEKKISMRQQILKSQHSKS